ncbi:MAG: hypothetical protein FJ255_10330 [Phycisphaerae bacterium]|nr:hypothetical protein [Phycisphaerae bacterium]
MMKALIVAALAAAVVAAGCEEKQPSPASGPQSTLGKVAESAKKTASGVTARSEEAAAEAGRQIGEAGKEAVAGVVDAAKSAAIDTGQKAVDLLGQKLDDLRKRAAAANPTLRAAVEPTLNELAERHVVLQKRMEELRSATGDRWRTVSDEINALADKADRIASDLAAQLR